MVVGTVVVADRRRLGQAPVSGEVVLFETLVLVAADHRYRVHGHVRRFTVVFVVVAGRFPVVEHAAVHAETLPAISGRHHDDASAALLPLLTMDARPCGQMSRNINVRSVDEVVTGRFWINSIFIECIISVPGRSELENYFTLWLNFFFFFDIVSDQKTL